MGDASKNTPQSDSHGSRKVTVLAPTSRDAKWCRDVLKEYDLETEVVSSIYDVTQRIRAGAGVLLISQEYLTSDAMEQLRIATASQPSWSDVPIIVLLVSDETSGRVITDLLALGNVTLVTRPLKIALLVSTLKARLRDRVRQYEVRDLLHKAQEANRSKSAFVANISHEIRTPMTSILGYAELMSSLIDNEDALGYLSTIRRNGDYLLRIINDLLDLSKIEAGKLDIDIERFELIPLIEDVRTIMDIRASEKGLVLGVDYVTPIPQSVESDAKRIRQILINLVGNAIKFTEHGTVSILVSLTGPPHSQRQKQSTSRQLQFQIVDSGIGMTSEQQQRLFKPFSQGDSLITQQFGGTGLGLAISQRLAAMLNGVISVKSRVKEGSSFTFSIPTGDIEDSPLVRPNRQAKSNRNSQPSTDIRLQGRFLVVDDRRDIRLLTNRIVTLAGGDVAEAEDGVQAIERVRQARSQGFEYDIILLDMQMPNKNGYETASELRELGYANPIVALTADAMQGDMSKCVSAGCNHHVSKPIDRSELLRLMCKLLAKDSNSISSD